MTTCRVRPAAAAAVSMRPLWLLLAMLLCLLVGRPLVHQSMFFDGMIYSSIARNMSWNVGSIWNPYFSKTLFPLFAEHPPLMMWLESIAFRIFGNTVAVEKGFSFLTLLACGSILLALWRLLNEDDPDFRRAGAFPLILALVAGRTSWAFANNMLENLLMVLTSLAVYLVARAYRQSVRPGFYKASLLVGAGLATGLALLSKGPVGLFPIAVPGIYWLAFRKLSLVHAAVDTFVVLATTTAMIVVLRQFPEPRAYMDRYVTTQLLSSLHGERGTTSGGLNAIRTLLRVNFYPVLVTATILIWARCSARGKSEGTALSQFPTRARMRRGIFLLLIGLSASIPLFISPRISSFYFNPSLPYFASALAIWCLPALLKILDGLDMPRRRLLPAILCGGVAISLVTVALALGSPGKDRAAIEDAAKIAGLICPSSVRCGQTIAACDAVWQDWQLHAYLQRYYELSLAQATADQSGYVIVNSDCIWKFADGYSEIEMGLSLYRLLRR